MNRRVFLQAGVAALALSASGMSRAVEGVNPSPYAAVGPFKAERRKVFGFFLFSCPFCQQYQPVINSWGRTIPAPVSFEPVPVVTDQASFRQAHAYYAVKQGMPEKLESFMTACFQTMSHGGAPSFYTEAPFLNTLGIDRKAFAKAWTAPAIRPAIVAAVTLAERYAIMATPSIAIGGAYVLDADRVDGDFALMMRLASGLVSRVLEGGRV